jgi:hypothetical protein
MAQTNVQRRDGGYYYRQKIPADLLVHYSKTEIVRSLRRRNVPVHEELNPLRVPGLRRGRE